MKAAIAQAEMDERDSAAAAAVRAIEADLEVDEMLRIKREERIRKTDEVIMAAVHAYQAEWKQLPLTAKERNELTPEEEAEWAAKKAKKEEDRIQKIVNGRIEALLKKKGLL